MKGQIWIPYVVAVCLVAVCLMQSLQLMKLQAGFDDAHKLLHAADDRMSRLEQSNALISLRLSSLEAKDPAYANARVFVAWDATNHRGSIALENFPLTPAGHEYQLWVLDPNAPAPVNAGVVTGARTFEDAACSMPRPGFAITLEPSGGSTSLTGPILFAVAPAE